jgi:hemoglobin
VRTGHHDASATPTPTGLTDGTDGITAAGLRRLVELFYARARADADLGPVFEDAVADWPEHLDRLAAFWSSVMLASGRYKGNPVAAHLRHRARLSPALFGRWLALWGEAAAEAMPPAAAAALRAKAARIAGSLQTVLASEPKSLQPAGPVPA